MPKKSSIKIIFLGGLNEVGRNIMVFEKDNNIVIIDCGIMFPDDYMPGIDFLIPDFYYIKKNAAKIKALVVTHGHEDHIGAIPFLLKEINPHTIPIYATKLTLGLIKSKLNNSYTSQSSGENLLNEIDPSKKLFIGPFEMEFFRVNHSIPDGVGIIFRTGIGNIVHTGDFKFDQYPIDGKVTEYSKISNIGQEGVLALFCDSTNAEEKGFTLPERDVGKSLYDKFEQAKKRIIVATFSSHIHRIQQVLDSAKKLDKKVAASGRTMLKTIKIASELGYLKIPEDTVIPITKIDDFPLNRIIILSTGSQGEPLSTLRKMALAEHTRVKIMRGDMVIISSSPIPGNENAISSTINMLLKQGADVFYESIAGVHVSGHAQQEEIKMMINLVKPEFFIPVHGEYKHRIQCAKLAESIGMGSGKVLVLQNGDTLKMNEHVCRVSGNITLQNIYIDGYGSGNTEDIVLKDRKILSRNGIIITTIVIDSKKSEIIRDADFVLKGIIYMEEFENIIKDAKEIISENVGRCFKNNMTNTQLIENSIKESFEKYISKKISARPVIIAKVIDVAGI
ncbi:MAG: ribonuclease J [Actinobacteria bacterium]|nr:ribonuclease J [Actinomycetota bacterium]